MQFSEPTVHSTLKHLPLAALVSACMMPNAWAQSADEEIIVTATRMERPLNEVPSAVTIVDQDAIQLYRQQLALDESLSRVPGVFMQARYNFARDVRVSIRGFGARANFGIRGVKIIVDGIPETLPDGQGGVDGIDLAATSQIEVLRGPSASIWGNASGGVISVTTEPPPAEGFTELRALGGEYGFQKLQFKTGRQGETLSYLVSLTDSEYDGYRDHALMENTQLTGRFNVDLGKGRELLSVLSYTDQPTSDDPGALNATLAETNPRMAWLSNVAFDAGEEQKKTRLGFVYNMPLKEGHDLQARSFIVARDFSNRLPTQGAGAVDLDSSYMGAGLSYTFEGSLGSKPNTFMVGFDLEEQDDDRLRYDNLMGIRGPLVFDQNEAVSSYGLFAQNNLALTSAMSLTVGLRFDEVKYDVTDYYLADGDDSGDVSLNDVSPMVGLTYDVTGRTSIYATYSTSFETPTTTEFNLPDGMSGGFNSNLDPQKAENLEFGVRGMWGTRTRYEAAIFDITVDDELVQFETPVPDRFYFANAASSSRQGVELSLTSQPTDRITTVVSYTYSDFKFDKFVEGGDDYSGNVIPGIPQDLLFAEIVYQVPEGLYAAFDVMYVGEQYAENANNVPVDSYTVGNLRFGYEIQTGNMQISPFLGIGNVFDERYPSDVRINAAFGGRYFDPAPDRNVYAGVSVRFGG